MCRDDRQEEKTDEEVAGVDAGDDDEEGFVTIGGLDDACACG